MGIMNYGNRGLVMNARSLRKSMTKAEIILWSRLRSKQLMGLKFRRQQPIMNYIVDFYSNKIKLIIEVDGEMHCLPGAREYDLKRERQLIAQGFHIIRFNNDEVELEINSVIRKIRSYVLNHFPELSSLSSEFDEK